MNNEIKAFLVNIKENEDYKEIYDYITNLQERIDKAIEYIKEMPDEEEYNGLLYDNEEKRDLLEILEDKGEDKE